MSVLSITCGNCGQGVAADVVAQKTIAVDVPGHSVPVNRNVTWLQCPSCGDGSVSTARGSVFPSTPAGRRVMGLPPDVEQAWREGRTAHAVAAYTAAEMMFRKILMHVAVDKAGSAPGKRFVEYVNDLEAGHYFISGLKDVVDRVRDRGNTANHELPASTERDSLVTMTITEHLLEGLYELPAMIPPDTP